MSVSSSCLQEVRNRYRYLGHLPLTCEFALCEVDLQPPIVSQSTLIQFEGKGLNMVWVWLYSSLCGVCSKPAKTETKTIKEET